MVIEQTAMRNYVYSLLDLHGNRDVLDIGCGKGYDLLKIGEYLGKESRLVGIDNSEKTITATLEASNNDNRFCFMVCDASERLPFEDESFDLVYSRDFLECVSNKEAVIKEMHRVLKKDGQVVCVHWDWDTQVINGNDKQLIRKVIHEFADWKQQWMADCDGWMGRRLWGVFNRSELFKGDIHTYVLSSIQFDESHIGYENIMNTQALVRHGKITEDESARFLMDINDTADRGEFFYCITSFVYLGRKLSA